MPNPSISTVFRAAARRNTMRATCWQASQHLGTSLSSLPFEGQPSVGARSKTPQSRQPGFFPLAQAVEYFLDHPVQPVGRLAPCPARLPGHQFRNFRLLHSAFTLTTEKRSEARLGHVQRSNYPIINNLISWKKLKSAVTRT